MEFEKAAREAVARWFAERGYALEPEVLKSLVSELTPIAGAYAATAVRVRAQLLKELEAAVDGPYSGDEMREIIARMRASAEEAA